MIRRVFERGAYADRALHAEAVGLEPRERALATRLAYGTVQRWGTLMHLVGVLADRPPQRLDPVVRAVVGLGLYQLLYADGIADHAAVNESVMLARRDGSEGGARLVNAVLRRAARDARTLVAELDDRTPEAAAVCHSVDVWLSRMWFEQLGAQRARSLLGAINEPAESALRVNTLVADPATVAGALGVGCRRDPDLPEALVLEGPFDAHGSELWSSGALMPQSRGSMLVARALDPEPGQRILDLCAAPGAKTTHLAALQSDQGEITAVESHPGRARALERTCGRMHVSSVGVQVGDAASPPALPGEFDRVLVDPPCSGLGTLQARPDLRWRATESSIAELVGIQRGILAAAAGAVAPGGLLVYSTCTISRLENEAQIERFLADHHDFALAEPRSDLSRWQHPDVASHLMALPDVHGTDGFFIARLRRDGAPPVRNGRPGPGTNAV